MYGSEDLDNVGMFDIEHSISAMRDAFYLLHALRDTPGTPTALARQIRLCDLILDTLAEMSSHSADNLCGTGSVRSTTCGQNLLIN
jgi:hypothetical protein